METADQHADQHDALRERFRAHIEHRGMSINEAARGVGMSAPAVSSWLGAKYRGDNERLARLVGRWLDTEAETARMRIGEPGTHADLAVTTRVQGFAAHAQANRDCVLVYGAAGSGKTHALRRYCEEHAGAWYASMSPAVTTAAAALARIARVLEVGAGVTTGARLEDVVVGHLARRNAVLVVVEAHHLSPALLDELRCVHDAAECGLVLAGNDPLWSRLVATERAGQLVSRIGAMYRLGRPNKADALALAGALLRRAPEGRSRKLVLEAAGRLGGLRSVVKLIGVAAMLARGEDREDVHDADLAEAAAHIVVGV